MKKYLIIIVLLMTPLVSYAVPVSWNFDGSLLRPLLDAWNVYAPANFRFDGEIQPDGSTCSNGEILKKTDANNWDCAADATGGGSGGGSWSTTTSLVSGQLLNYPNNTTDIVMIGHDSATSSAEFYYDPNEKFFFVSSASSTIAGPVVVVGNFSPLSNIVFAGDTIDELVGTGLQLTSGDLQTTLGLDIGVAELASVDFGDWTCNGSTCMIDADSIALTTDTTGNYVNSITANQGILLTGTEGASVGLIACTDGQILKNVSGTSWACGADATGAGGSGNVATSTNETAGRLSYWTSTSATPATLGEVATTTLTATSPVALSQPISVIGASASAVSITGDGITDTQLAFNTGQHLTTTSNVIFANATTTNATTTQLAISGVTSSILKTNANGTVGGISATGTEQMVNGFFLPDATCTATACSWPQPSAINFVNDLSNSLIFVASSTSAKTGFHGKFHVPEGFNGSVASVQLLWTCPSTTGDKVWDLDYRAIGGDDTESLDQATWQESLTITDACPSAAFERNLITFNLTASNLAADDTVEFYIAIDGADAADTGDSDAEIHDLVFKYSR